MRETTAEVGGRERSPRRIALRTTLGFQTSGDQREKSSLPRGPSRSGSQTRKKECWRNTRTSPNACRSRSMERRRWERGWKARKSFMGEKDGSHQTEQLV